jgi:hypothetical protein
MSATATTPTRRDARPSDTEQQVQARVSRTQKESVHEVPVQGNVARDHDVVRIVARRSASSAGWAAEHARPVRRPLDRGLTVLQTARRHPARFARDTDD